MSGARASGVVLSGLRRQYDGVVAVDNLDLDLPAGSFTALLGPSGCGKTTTLAIVAGLLAPDAGDVTIAGVAMGGVAAERRPVGTVFQRPLLFPHLTVAQNVAFGLRMRRIGRAEVRRRVGSMLERVQLDALAGRRVGELSGGQEQRAALARALVLEPPVLLLDEPFSQLDAALRLEMRSLVRALHDEREMTTLFVTHDQTEAVQVADAIALMLEGRLAGHDTPQAFYAHPPSLAAARFFGVANEVTGLVHQGRFVSADGDVEIDTSAPAGPGVLVIRPESLLLLPEGTPGAIPAVTTDARFAGTHISVTVQRAGGDLLTVHAPVGEPLPLGCAVGVGLRAGAATIVAP